MKNQTEAMHALFDDLIAGPGIISEDYARAKFDISDLRTAMAEFAEWKGIDAVASGYALCPDWKGGKRWQDVFCLYAEDVERLQVEARIEWENAQAEYRKREAAKAEYRAANPDWDLE